MLHLALMTVTAHILPENTNKKGKTSILSVSLPLTVLDANNVKCKKLLKYSAFGLYILLS